MKNMMPQIMTESTLVRVDNMPLVSIITPFYNADLWLAECIESILAQSYQNWEYVLVNNRSTDRSLDIAERYARTDPRLRVVTNEEFLNQIQNYNHALSLISNDSVYCKVCQADDWLFPECLERMVALALRYPSAGIISSYRLKGEVVAGSGLPHTMEFVPGRQLARLHIEKELSLFGSPTTLLLRSDLVRNRKPFYADGSYHEDTDVCFELLRSCDFAFVHQVLSYTRTDNESITKSAYQFNPGVLDNFLRLVRYGSEYLPPDQYHRISAQKRREYYLFLAQGIVSLKGRAFREYHLKGLAASGVSISRWRLAFYVGWVLVDYILNPKDSAMAIWRRVRHRRKDVP